jgi:hypothetical protein
MSESANGVLAKMLERLFASLVNGPSLNCRPHSSRQRIDLVQFAKLGDLSPIHALRELLGDERQVKVSAKVPPPKRTRLQIPVPLPMQEPETREPELSAEERAAQKAWSEQESVLSKIRTIVEDAKTYEQDTGAHVLNIGFPLLSLPPNSLQTSRGSLSRRIIAPIAFIPVNVTVKMGTHRGIEINCRGDGIDLVTPNIALLAWLEQQSGLTATDLFADEKGEAPWREITELIAYVAKMAGVTPPSVLTGLQLEQGGGSDLELCSAPRSDDNDDVAILPSAVLGLFPLANQGLLRDTQDLLSDASIQGPLESFIKLDSSLTAASLVSSHAVQTIEKLARVFAQERLVTDADPCQSKAVRLARACKGLVVHGPPGTGKSQTITNIIGDHLHRGERVLVVCDKRTALDVVANRLENLGLRNLCALVHDPQRDRRDLYKAIRQQLEDLAEAKSDSQADRQLAGLDAELQRLHAELTAYETALMKPDPRSGFSFHELMGRWLSIAPTSLDLDAALLSGVSLKLYRPRQQDVQDILDRSLKINYPENPWRKCWGFELGEFLARPMGQCRDAVSRCLRATADADAAADPAIPPFEGAVDLTTQAQSRAELGVQLKQLLSEVDASVLRHWAGKDGNSPAEARTALDQTASALEVMRAAPLDAELLARCLSDLPNPQATMAMLKVIEQYSHGFALWATPFVRVKSRVPSASSQFIVHWLAKDPQARSRVSKRLEQMKVVAEEIGSGLLDRQMILQYRRDPITITKVVQWLGLLNGYLETASKWHAFLHAGAKKAAMPVSEYFGLPLNTATAIQIRDFLKGLRIRLELKADLEDGILQQALTELVSDEDLLTAFTAHHDLLKAMTDGGEPGGEVPTVDTADMEVLHGLMLAVATAAKPVFDAYGLVSNHANALRLITFLGGFTARLTLQEVLNLADGKVHDTLASDVELERGWTGLSRILQIVDTMRNTPTLLALAHPVAKAMRDPDFGNKLVRGLELSLARANAIRNLLNVFANANLFSTKWTAAVEVELRKGATQQPLVQALSDRIDDLENVARVSKGLLDLPAGLREPVGTLLRCGASTADGGAVLMKAALGSELSQRLASDPSLLTVDGQRLKSCFERYRLLDRQKRDLVRDSILHQWLSRQKERLLSNNGSRLNSLGAELRRRLTIQGERAMRLRQVVTLGRQTQGGDPLFDICPVWMASPETVAQLFPREPIFDLVIFDEASQCRLEEALPVLTRAKRVVIAGDPKQLPPTRFFESAVAASEDDEAETDQELFESQQGEIEDLLGAALNLEIQECYLDVHYRSRNSDLIQFSNEHFYGSRLQAIPGHPSNRQRLAPLRVHQVNGIYEKRRNVLEGQKVVELVKELLGRDNPPSIGIACFNLTQRDLINDALDDAALSDEEFARRLAAARIRRGAGSFDGLFVKNLENVQGDERDHIIISTTFGPDPKGKFYRRFGPIGRAGGGRRLNVLVTRAREEVHIVSSIPPTAYLTLPPIPAGQTAGGAWLLFSYLQFAKQLQEDYELAHRILAQAEVDKTARVEVRKIKSPSRFAQALGQSLARSKNIGSDVHWGNDGFCVDLALHHPRRAEDVTIGILCDVSRFTQAEDTVEWDVFRTGILESQGWVLQRLWTPHFFRDPDAGVRTITDGITAFLVAGEAGQGVRVSS